jgi:N-acylneuraminate cytidylyltransferase
VHSVLAVVPARSGSKGLPGKNIRPLAGLPLIAHSLRFAAMCPEIVRTIVSTDSEDIARVARKHGGDVPFLRPPELARDDTPTWPVLRHALAQVDPDGERFEYLALLEPTSPARLPEDLDAAARRLTTRADADGVVSVSEPPANPIWHAVVEREGVIEHLVPEGRRYERRQDLPRVLELNGLLYVWRASFVREHDGHWLEGRHVGYEVPARRAFHIDSVEDFELCELLVENGLVRLPWLAGG